MLVNDFIQRQAGTHSLFIKVTWKKKRILEKLRRWMKTYQIKCVYVCLFPFFFFFFCCLCERVNKFVTVFALKFCNFCQNNKNRIRTGGIYIKTTTTNCTTIKSSAVMNALRFFSIWKPECCVHSLYVCCMHVSERNTKCKNKTTIFKDCNCNLFARTCRCCSFFLSFFVYFFVNLFF